MSRTGVRILVIAALVAAGSAITTGIVLEHRTPPGPSQIDREVCSHVHPGPMGAAGDWDTPAVARLAYQASPEVRGAYLAAASTQIPLGATPEQMQVVMMAWGQLENVCAGVNSAR